MKIIINLIFQVEEMYVSRMVSSPFSLKLSNYWQTISWPLPETTGYPYRTPEETPKTKEAVEFQTR